MDKHFVAKSDTPEGDKDLWRTPIELFRALDREFCFTLDVCADHNNKLAPNHFSIERSALEHEWDIIEHESAFMNPPYSQTELFLNRAAHQSRKHNITTVALVNANTDTKWFADAVLFANEIRLISGRVGFIRKDGKKASGNTKGQCLIIWRGKCDTPCNITMVSRDQLMRDE